MIVTANLQRSVGEHVNKLIYTYKANDIVDAVDNFYHLILINI